MSDNKDFHDRFSNLDGTKPKVEENLTRLGTITKWVLIFLAVIAAFAAFGGMAIAVVVWAFKLGPVILIAAIVITLFVWLGKSLPPDEK